MHIHIFIHWFAMYASFKTSSFGPAPATSVCLSLRQKNVFGFQVSVADTYFMQTLQAFGYLGKVPASSQKPGQFFVRA